MPASDGPGGTAADPPARLPLAPGGMSACGEGQRNRKEEAEADANDPGGHESLSRNTLVAREPWRPVAALERITESCGLKGSPRGIAIACVVGAAGASRFCTGTLAERRSRGTAGAGVLVCEAEVAAALARGMYVTVASCASSCGVRPLWA